MNETTLKGHFKKPKLFRVIFLIVVQSLLALLFDVFGLGVGSVGTFTFLKYASNFIYAGPFILLLYPPLLSSDVGIGAFISNLGTNLHLGTIKPQFFKNTKTYNTLFSAVLILGVFSSLWIGMITYIINLVVFSTNKIINPLPFIVIPILTSTFSSVISILIGSVMAFIMFRKKLNPDVYLYPIISTVHGFICTLLYAATIIVLNPAKWFETDKVNITQGTYWSFIPVLLYIIFIIFIISKKISNKEFRKILREAIPIQTITLTINSLTGGILSSAEEKLKIYRGLFLIYPALIDTLADEVTIIANTTSTNIAMGTIQPRISEIKDHKMWTNIVGVGIAGIILHLVYGIFGSIITGDYANMGIVVGFGLGINVIGFLCIQTVSFFLIIFSYKKGFDPNNYAIPIIAALTNLLTSALLLIFTLAL